MKRPVLVVDDDRDIREAIRDTVSDGGYEVAEATNGVDALEYLRSHPPPPLILLDWNMAPMNGSEFMDEVLKDPALSVIPVVLLTADGRAFEKAKTKGFVGWLRKPVSLDALFEILNRHYSP
jgi:CheY-like chemotaxis protein